jgi:hypothetical protein
MRIKLAALLLIALGSLTANASGGAELCHSEFRNWLQKYGGGDPFQAIEKTTPWPFLQSVLFQLPNPDVQIRDEDLSNFHFRSEAESAAAKQAFLSTLKDPVSPDTRDLVIRQNLTEFVRSHQNVRHSLSIAYVGLYHGIDLFVSSPNLNPTYINKPIALDTLTEPREMRQLQEYLKIPTPAETVGGDSISYFSLPYLYAKQSVVSLKLPRVPARTFQAQDANNRLLVLSELHGMVSTDWISGLPTASCLKSMGVTVVHVAMEGYAKGHKFTPDDVIRRRTLIEQFSYRAQKIGLTLSELTARFPESIGRKLAAGEIVDNPAPLILAKVLLAYQGQGLTVQMEGLESPDYNELEGD